MSFQTPDKLYRSQQEFSLAVGFLIKLLSVGQLFFFSVQVIPTCYSVTYPDQFSLTFLFLVDAVNTGESLTLDTFCTCWSCI